MEIQLLVIETLKIHHYMNWNFLVEFSENPETHLLDAYQLGSARQPDFWRIFGGFPDDFWIRSFENPLENPQSVQILRNFQDVKTLSSHCYLISCWQPRQALPLNLSSLPITPRLPPCPPPFVTAHVHLPLIFLL